MSNSVAIAYLKELEKLFMDDDPVRVAIRMAIEALKDGKKKINTQKDTV